MAARLLAVASCAALAAGCSGGTAPAPVTTSSSAIRALPGDCAGFDVNPSLPQITFSVRGSIYASSPDGSNVRCLFQNGPDAPMTWGPAGNGLLMGEGEVAASGSVVPPSKDVEGLRWSRPSGKSLIWIAEDGRVLRKRSGSRELDISFLGHHEEAVYHPAGMNIAAAGELDEEYGIYLASNTGGNVQPLTRGERARRIHSLSYANDGRLFFAADHGDRQDVHALGSSGNLQTIESGHEQFGAVTASPFSRPVAYRKGSCGSRTSVRVWNGSAPKNLGAGLDGRSTEPVGWLADGRLVVLARERGCDGPAELYVWSQSRATLLARDVTHAAVRAVLPPPPPPPRPAEGAPA